MKKITILGSTGSVGVNTIKTLDNLKGFKVECLTAYSNLKSLSKQANKYKPSFLGIEDKKGYSKLTKMLRYRPREIFFGQDGLKEISKLNKSEVIVIAIVGCAGLIPLIESIKNNKKIVLANKESLVSAGEIVMGLLKRHKAKLIPIDSEHNAIFQCLEAENYSSIRRIILTASGGPFCDYKLSRLKTVTPHQALAHPKWRMGKKISIDSATLMNKGLEVIEARWLFDVEVKKIEVLIHKEAMVHSMVEFIDGNIKALIGPTDMKLPIHYALTYPERQPAALGVKYSDLANLTFTKPDLKKFPALKLCFKAARIRGTMPAVLNASNEIAVSAFIKKKISFMDIPKVIGKVMNKHKLKRKISLSVILEADDWARKETSEVCKI